MKEIYLLGLFSILFCQYGIYYLYIKQCDYPKISSKDEDTCLKVALVTDIHMLGNRRRLWVERQWVDLQLSTSYSFILKIHSPQAIFILGDQFDEGSFPTDESKFKDYTRRFFKLFITRPSINRTYLMGNHDSEFGAFLSRTLYQRYQTSFGNANQLFKLKNITFVQLNTLVLDETREIEIQDETIKFIQNVSSMRQNDSSPLYLLTHIPLYRPNDLKCGKERANEKGHVTYAAASDPLYAPKDVISKEKTDWLLSLLKPSGVLSGHLHARCRYEHELNATQLANYFEFKMGSKLSVVEWTIPTFGWGMRPDPSYGLATICSDQIDVEICGLPYEKIVFGLYALTVIIILIVLCIRIIKRFTVSKTKEK